MRHATKLFLLQDSKGEVMTGIPLHLWALCSELTTSPRLTRAPISSNCSCEYETLFCTAWYLVWTKSKVFLTLLTLFLFGYSSLPLSSTGRVSKSSSPSSAQGEFSWLKSSSLSLSSWHCQQVLSIIHQLFVWRMPRLSRLVTALSSSTKGGRSRSCRGGKENGVSLVTWRPKFVVMMCCVGREIRFVVEEFLGCQDGGYVVSLALRRKVQTVCTST